MEERGLLLHDLADFGWVLGGPAFLEVLVGILRLVQTPTVVHQEHKVTVVVDAGRDTSVVFLEFVLSDRAVVLAAVSHRVDVGLECFDELVHRLLLCALTRHHVRVPTSLVTVSDSVVGHIAKNLLQFLESLKDNFILLS